jgi:hypothetical protein
MTNGTPARGARGERSSSCRFGSGRPAIVVQQPRGFLKCKPDRIIVVRQLRSPPDCCWMLGTLSNASLATRNSSLAAQRKYFSFHVVRRRNSKQLSAFGHSQFERPSLDRSGNAGCTLTNGRVATRGINGCRKAKCHVPTTPFYPPCICARKTLVTKSYEINVINSVSPGTPRTCYCVRTVNYLRGGIYIRRSMVQCQSLIFITTLFCIINQLTRPR